MTNEETIRILMAMKDGLIHVFDHDRKEALSLAISALEKQIPKKPIEPDGLFYKCPICKNCIRDYNRYCTVCGHKLDWSEDEG